MRGINLFLLLGSTGLDGRRKCDEIRGVEGRETTEESNLEQFLPTQNFTGNQFKKEKKKWASVFPLPLNHDPHASCQRSLLPMRHKPFSHIQQILCIADFPADSCEKGTMKINESR